MVALGATREQRSGLPGTAVARDFEAGVRCSSSLTSLASDRSMSSRVMTMTGAPTASSATGVRVAVTTVSSRSSCAKAAL